VRTVTHLFDTKPEADAFQEGVDWVNDSAITFSEEFVSGEPGEGQTFGVVYTDDDGDEDVTFDHQEGAPT
jgi:hypothetical protein